jgi:hypothetical protein
MAATVNTLVIHADRGRDTISRNIYGQFSEHLGQGIYDGIWVGEDSPIPNTRGIRNDVVAALKKIEVPVLRWPGGCFADEYHWKDGIGPAEKRPAIINTTWGGVVENNHFGTHEFMDRGRALRLWKCRQRHGSGDDGMGGIYQFRCRFAAGQSSAAKRPRGSLAAAVLRDRQRELGVRREHDARVLRR